MSRTSIACFSCTHANVPVRFDSLIAQKVNTLYFVGDIAYMDGGTGSPNYPYAGEQAGASTYPATGGGAQITVGAATAGLLPAGAATVTSGGVGYGFDPTYTYDGQLAGQGLTTGASISFSISTAITFTASLSSATSATLTAGLTEGSGKFWIGFSDGSRRLVTVAGTACTWTGNVTASASATYAQGGLATFTGALTAATSGTLTAPPARGNGTYLFSFSDGSSRVCTVVGSVVSWGVDGPVTATTAASYADGRITSCTVITPGAGATNSGSAVFSVVDWNGTAGLWRRRYAQVMGTAAWQDLQTARAAGQIRLKFYPDDHERSNNWDFSITQTPWGCFLLSDVLNLWRTTRQGILTEQAKWFDNFPTAGREIPPSMVGIVGSAGVATAADFDWWLDYDDYDANNNLIGTPGAGPLAVRVIVIDCISAKSTMATADTSTKQMIGPLQEAEEKRLVLDAVTKGAKAIWSLSDKDYFNLDNQDGWGATAGGGNFPYLTARDRRLTWMDANNIPVVYWSGDRHCWHVSYTAKSNGDAYDSLCVCSTPFGSTNNTVATTNIGNTVYPQLLVQGRTRDQVVHGVITYDGANGQTIISVNDNCDDKEQVALLIPFGSRVPTSLMTGLRMTTTP